MVKQTKEKEPAKKPASGRMRKKVTVLVSSLRKLSQQSFRLKDDTTNEMLDELEKISGSQGSEEHKQEHKQVGLGEDGYEPHYRGCHARCSCDLQLIKGREKVCTRVWLFRG